MKVTIELEKEDYNVLHDIVYGLTSETLTNDELKLIWDNLPEYLKLEAVHWGVDDTVVRDNIYEHLKKSYE
jgi:hypothetical protein